MTIALGVGNKYHPERVTDERVVDAALFLLQMIAEIDPQAAAAAVVEASRINEERTALLLRAAIGDASPLYWAPKQEF